MAGPVLSLPIQTAECSPQKLFDGFFIINGFVDILLKFGSKFPGSGSVFDAPWTRLFNLWYAINGTDIVIPAFFRSEEHTSELQSRENLVCRLLLEKKNNTPPRRRRVRREDHSRLTV